MSVTSLAKTGTSQRSHAPSVTRKGVKEEGPVSLAFNQRMYNGSGQLDLTKEDAIAIIGKAQAGVSGAAADKSMVSLDQLVMQLGRAL